MTFLGDFAENNILNTRKVLSIRLFLNQGSSGKESEFSAFGNLNRSCVSNEIIAGFQEFIKTPETVSQEKYQGKFLNHSWDPVRNLVS